MAYIPDEWILENLKIAHTTERLLFYYCGRADQDTGETFVSPQRASQDLEIRKDHVDEHDRKLTRAGFIAVTVEPSGGRIVRLLSPWQPRAERDGHPAQRIAKKTTSQVLGNSPQLLGKPVDVTPQNLGSPLNSSPSFGEIPQVLGEPSQDLGKSPQNLGEIPQNLGTHIRNITSSCNQLIEPVGGARPRDRYDFNDLPFASESPRSTDHTNSEQNPKQTQGAPPAPAPSAPPPDRTPVTIYAQVSKRQLAIAEIDLIENRVPQNECDQFERFLTGWAASYGTKAVFKVLEVYDQRKPNQSAGFIGRAWTADELADYHADMRRLADARKADKPVARASKPVQPAVASGTETGGDGRMADGAKRRPAKGMAPTLQFGALIEAQKRIQQTLDSRRPAVRVEETPSGADLECPF